MNHSKGACGGLYIDGESLRLDWLARKNVNTLDARYLVEIFRDTIIKWVMKLVYFRSRAQS